jgi:hypothetical protein
MIAGVLTAHVLKPLFPRPPRETERVTATNKLELETALEKIRLILIIPRCRRRISKKH